MNLAREMIRGKQGDPNWDYNYIGDCLIKWESIEEKTVLQQPLLWAPGGLGGANLRYVPWKI